LNPIDVAAAPWWAWPGQAIGSSRHRGAARLATDRARQLGRRPQRRRGSPAPARGLWARPA